jgi:hypothetical protein
MNRRLAHVAMWLVLSAAPAFGQGCAMCYTGAHAAGAKAQIALNRGIGALMVTTLSMIGGLALLAYRTRNSGQDPTTDEATDLSSSPE